MCNKHEITKYVDLKYPEIINRVEVVKASLDLTEKILTLIIKNLAISALSFVPIFVNFHGLNRAYQKYCHLQTLHTNDVIDVSLKHTISANFESVESVESFESVA